jgi:hypothetical protein
MLKSELKALLNAEARSPIADLKYLRVSQVPRRYPISRALLYQWLNDGKIKSVLIPGPGGVRGIRFILASSIEDFLERLAEEQKDESFTPAVAREYNTGRRGRRSGGRNQTPLARARRPSPSVVAAGGPGRWRQPHERGERRRRRDSAC